MSATITSLLEIRTVSMKGVPIFGCVTCGKHGAGSTVRIEIYAALGISPEQIAHTVESHPISPNHLPVGWSSNVDGYRCPSCTNAA